ncbi:MAG TPA: PAS domain S-box protein [Myxococcales bacterium]|nr:PAS domain S-box protein [Myxococcales bacterium]
MAVAGIVIVLSAAAALLVARRRRRRAGGHPPRSPLGGGNRSEKMVADALGYARTLLETSPVGVITYRASGEAIEANRAAAEMVGGTVEELKAGNFRKLESWKASGLLGAATEALETGRERQIEVPHTSTYGRHLRLYCNFVPFQFGGERQLLALLTDMTERKRTEAANALFRELLDRSNDIIEVFDPATGRLLDANGRACQELGFSREEILSLRAADLYAAIGGAASGQVEAMFRRPGALPTEGLHRRKDGSTFPVEVSISRVSLDREYAVAMVRDVTSERQLEAQLRQAQKMETIGQFAGAIAHDFNNLLSVIMTYASLLGSELDPADPRRADAGEIEQAAARAAALTRQLLAFSRSQVLEPRVLDLNQVISGMEKMLRRLLTESVELVIVPGRGLGSVKADAGQIEQVIMNLAANARDAMPEGGRLVLETANVEAGALPPEPERIPPGSWVMLSVADTGTGMDAETMRRAFEPFFTTTEKGKGTGLGLSTCYGIVKQSGGYISVSSEPGSGTVFRIYLPRVDERADARPASPADEARGPAGSIEEGDDHFVGRCLQSDLFRRDHPAARPADEDDGRHRSVTGDLELDAIALRCRDGRHLRRRDHLHPHMKTGLRGGGGRGGTEEEEGEGAQHARRWSKIAAIAGSRF